MPSLVAERDALDEAEVVDARRVREAAAAEAAEIRAKNLAERQTANDAYLANFQTVLDAATELVDAIGAALASAAARRAIDVRLGGDAPGDMGQFAVIRRMSDAIGERLSPLGGKLGGQSSFGSLVWNFSGLRRDRMQIERKALGAHLNI